MKVSFDFDETLSRKVIQDFAFSLMKKGVDVWVCTSRNHPDIAEEGWNDDLFKVTDELNIPREKIIFTSYKNKFEFLDDSFVWHLDDDWVELNMLNRNSNVRGISPYGNSTWKRKCLAALGLPIKTKKVKATKIKGYTKSF